MLLTTRELNAFGNVLKYKGRLAFAKKIHEQVLWMLKKGLTEMDFEAETSKGEYFCSRVKDAENYLRFLKRREGIRR